jgi:hypothetical protein
MFHDAAVRLHNQERNVAGRGADLVDGALQVGAAIGFDQHIDQRRHGALVFAVFRQHHRRQRDENGGEVLGDEFADALLVRVVGVGVQQTNGDAAHAVLQELLHGGDDGSFVERLELAAIEAQPTGHLAHEMQRHQSARFHPEEGIAVAVRHRLPRDFDQMAEALGNQKPQAVELVLEHGIGRDRRTVQQHVHVGRLAAGGFENLAHAFDQADARILGRGRRLGGGNVASVLVDGDDVGEGTAGIDCDSQAHLIYPSFGYNIRILHIGRKRGPERAQARRIARTSPVHAAHLTSMDLGWRPDPINGRSKQAAPQRRS